MPVKMHQTEGLRCFFKTSLSEISEQMHQKIFQKED
jgi:hypothetical protein